MLKKILIVDDVAINRKILCVILSDEYQVCEAGDGKEAVALLADEDSDVSAVLLDLLMPGMNGFEVLAAVRSDPATAAIPILVVTGNTEKGAEIKALALGANDYITKPYVPNIIKYKLKNILSLRDTSPAVQARREDELTGLYTRECFFELTSTMIAHREAGYYVMACFDINRFKVINDQYGMQKGDEVLRHIARIFKEGFEANGGICCRIAADDFAVLYPASFQNSDQLAKLRRLATTVEGIAMPLAFSIGRYVITDLSMPPNAMCDRAMIALDSVKGRYDVYIGHYNESMRKRLLDEQKIVNEMSAALAEGQFEPWFQPQYNHRTGALIGCEALVRWRHPQIGIVPPCDFIPVFERNGFIYEMDKYIWERVCVLLRRWMDEGRNPLPVSVNVSRYDLEYGDFYGVITSLLKRYTIPTHMLRLEVTESAFAQSADKIIFTVKKLIEYGFTVEIDDFGSGYSSLNTLKDVPATVLKLDMKFLKSSDDSQRGGNILESIVRMAKWLNMSVIAEGVETVKHADFLKSIGCDYVQGYLYARPMPLEAYAELEWNTNKQERLFALETVQHLDNNAFWDPNSMDSLIFSSYVGGACIFEYCNGKIELLRANEKYVQVISGAGLTLGDALKLDWTEHLAEKDRETFREALEQSTKNGEEITGEFLFLDLPGCPRETFLRTSLRVIASSDARRLVYCTNDNITARRMAERRAQELAERMRIIMDNVNGGICAATLQHGGDAQILFANDTFYAMYGYTREQFENELASPLDAIHPDDRQELMAAITKMGLGDTASYEYRCVRRDESVIHVRCNQSVISIADINGNVLLSVITDTTERIREEQRQKALLDNLPCGAALYEYDGGNAISCLHINKRYWELVHRAPEKQVTSILNAVHPDDRAAISCELASAIQEKRDAACDIRIRHGEGGYRPFRVTGHPTLEKNGKHLIYTAYTPISNEAMSLQATLSIALRTMMEAQTGFSFIKNKNLQYICASRAIYEAAGFSSEAELVGKTDCDILGAALADDFSKSDHYVMERGESLVDLVGCLPLPDGTKRYVSTSKFPLKDSDGATIGIYGVGRDITEARAMQSHLELLTNSIPGGIASYEYSPEGIRLLYFNDGFYQLFGLTREEYEAKAVKAPTSLIFQEDLPELMAQVKATIAHGTPMDCVYRVRVAGGGHKWISHKAVATDRHGLKVNVNVLLQDVTAQQEMMERLRLSEEGYRLAIRQSETTVCRYDVASRSLTVPENVTSVYGLRSVIENIPDSEVRAGNISPDTAAAYTAFYESILRGEKNGVATFQRTSNTGWRWIKGRFSTLFSRSGKPVSAIISYLDVTENIEKEIAYIKYQQSLKNREPSSYTLFRCNLSRNASFDTVEGALLNVRFNPARLEFNERTAEYVAQCVWEDDKARYVAFLNSDTLLANYYRGKRSGVLEFREKLPTGGVRWLRLSVELVEYPNTTDVEVFLMYEDINARKQNELQTRELAETDPLTGILNRNAFARKMNELLGRRKSGTLCALFMFDIDGFKLVNDSFGHAAGDQTLLEIARKLRSILRGGDLAGRLGGDEFLVCLQNMPDKTAIGRKAQQICDALRQSFSAEVRISASLGIAVCPDDGADFETLYHQADIALYHEKGSGKGHYVFYENTMDGEKPRVALVPATDGQMRPPAGEPKRRMLIVEDNRLNSELLVNMFKDEFIIDTADDGRAALFRLRRYGACISVVLLDLMMPDMDGFTVLEKMRESPEINCIPVVVVSGMDEREASLKAIRCGASDFVTKPVDPGLLRLRVQSAISKAENERLRVENHCLMRQNDEAARYRTALESNGIALIEYDGETQTFSYDQALSQHIAGRFDQRDLWQILLDDRVASPKDVEAMRELVKRLVTDSACAAESLAVQLRTPANHLRRFQMKVARRTDTVLSINKLLLTFTCS